MNITFSANDAYAMYLATALVSILENRLEERAVTFYILTADMSIHNKNMLSSLVTSYPNTTILFVSIDATMFKDMPLNIRHITKESYFRYLIAEVLPGIKKVLYLDVDVLVLSDLWKLYKTDIRSYFIAGSHKDYFAREFPGYKTKIGLKEDDVYINAGVVLFNLEKIRQFNKVAELFNNTKKLKNIIRIQDQDIINITFNKAIKNFSNKYNYTESDRQSGKERHEDIAIVHFNTDNKPWNVNFKVNDTNSYFIKRYHKYAEKVAQFTAGRIDGKND